MSEREVVVPYVALLRGINVGGRRKVPMAALRELLAARGFGAVRTHLQSGNAVFTAPPRGPAGLAAELSGALGERFGFPVECVVRSGEELRRGVARCPFPVAELDPARLLVVFLDGPATDHPVAALDPASFAPDEFRLGEREVFAHFPGGMGRGRLGQRLAAPAPGLVATGRNWRTVERLLALVAEAPGGAGESVSR
ncbi:DUF1697 domain-containing protein [Streptomyces sp. DSM 44915]|uniref:DUF1697 domain-containing protein n=1 Tax=Streptomyces chisholmiae TaxID=3075540 RepID=A0ABU2JNL3_9ACTN|nr:DUF1697 domain-containing protein [Streptomyces sp. DSM 44915]MDT0266308.1 DUF1697 domain-containing protein [Streptomyces sp. DSM 44915]